MKFWKSKLTLLTLAVAVMGVVLLNIACQGTAPQQETKTAAEPAGDLAAFAAVAPIDTHVHVYEDDPAFNAMVKQLNLHILNICLIDERDAFFKALEPQRSDVLKVRKSTDGRAVFCTT